MNSLEPKGIAYYNNLINELIKNDIIPLVSIINNENKNDEVRL